jgi:hypothetical protein
MAVFAHGTGTCTCGTKLSLIRFSSSQDMHVCPKRQFHYWCWLHVPEQALCQEHILQSADNVRFRPVAS